MKPIEEMTEEEVHTETLNTLYKHKALLNKELGKTIKKLEEIRRLKND